MSPLQERYAYSRVTARMDLASLVQTYGYLAVFIGTLLEGETVLALAGLAAHRGYLALPWVIAVAALGGFLGDQIYFLVGRRNGARVLARFPRLAPGIERIERLLERYGAPIVVLVRFMYGLRAVGPIAISMTSMHWTRFAAFNALGATLWATLVASLGYALGNALTLLLGDLRRIEAAVFAAVAVVGIAAVLIVRARRRRATQSPGPSP
ncbi:MAG TPA: DedA family protein [Burkholderiales bacterium]|nr:DedA family protein [Burkholderiales bacterium]